MNICYSAIRCCISNKWAPVTVTKAQQTELFRSSLGGGLRYRANGTLYGYNVDDLTVDYSGLFDWRMPLSLQLRDISKRFIIGNVVDATKRYMFRPFPTVHVFPVIIKSCWVVSLITSLFLFSVIVSLITSLFLFSVIVICVMVILRNVQLHRDYWCIGSEQLEQIKRTDCW